MKRHVNSKSLYCFMQREGASVLLYVCSVAIMFSITVMLQSSPLVRVNNLAFFLNYTQVGRSKASDRPNIKLF